MEGRRLVMSPKARLWVGLVAGVLVLVGCSGGDGDIADESTESVSSTTEGPAVTDDEELVVSDSSLTDLGFEPATIVVANSHGTLTTNGPQRLMTAVLEPSGIGYLGGADEPVQVVVRPFQAVSELGEQRLDSMWLTADDVELGLYLSNPVFDSVGTWEVRIEAAGTDIGGTVVEVFADSSVPDPGSAAPLSVTNPYNGVSNIYDFTTDQEPNLDFYRLSVDAAVSNGRPTVVAFATPAFCQTALCGPTLEWVKQATAGRDDIDVVHVEPFDLEQAKTGVLIPVEAMTEWNLPSEPWVFVVDETGTVTASFEGIFAPSELSAALDAL